MCAGSGQWTHWPLITDHCPLISGAGVTPAGDLFQACGAGLFEKADAVAGVLELVNVGPDLGLPGLIVNRGFATSGAAGVQFARYGMRRSVRLEFDEDAAHFLDIFICSDHVFVAQNVAKAQLASFPLGFCASVERAILGAQLLGRVTGHPKRFLVDHSASPQENFAPTVPPTASNRETRISRQNMPSNSST